MTYLVTRLADVEITYMTELETLKSIFPEIDLEVEP